MSNPRIISGTARGKRIQPVPGDITRPITDRVKEAVFNIISADIVDANFLDLFGGTGSVVIRAGKRRNSPKRLPLNRPGPVARVCRYAQGAREVDSPSVR